MSGRKSTIGCSSIARAPRPFEPGKPWWTSPPVAAPDPAELEYVERYAVDLAMQPGSASKNALQTAIGAWLRAARRLVHEAVAREVGDLVTPEGLEIAVAASHGRLRALVCELGGQIPPQDERIGDLLTTRATALRRNRAINGPGPAVTSRTRRIP